MIKEITVTSYPHLCLKSRKISHIARIVFKREDAAFRNPVFSKSRHFGSSYPTVEGGEGKTSFICSLLH